MEGGVVDSNILVEMPDTLRLEFLLISQRPLLDKLKLFKVGRVYFYTLPVDAPVLLAVRLSIHHAPHSAPNLLVQGRVSDPEFQPVIADVLFKLQRLKFEAEVRVQCRYLGASRLCFPVSWGIFVPSTPVCLHASFLPSNLYACLHACMDTDFLCAGLRHSGGQSSRRLVFHHCRDRGGVPGAWGAVMVTCT